MDTHGSIIHIYYPVTYLSYIWFYWQNTSTKNEQPNMDTYGMMINIYIQQLHIRHIFSFTNTVDESRKMSSQICIRMAETSFRHDTHLNKYSYVIGLCLISS